MPRRVIPKPRQKMERLLSADEVAEFLGIPVATLYQWRNKGCGPDAYRVGRHLRYGFAADRAAYDEDAAVWTLTDPHGTQVRSRVVVSSVGQLNRPRFPDIPGRDTFEGTSWHSARWKRLTIGRRNGSRLSGGGRGLRMPRPKGRSSERRGDCPAR